MNAPADPLAGYQEQRNAPAETGSAIQGLSLVFGLYQRYVGGNRGYSCPMEPSCSAYSREALARHGIWRGMTLTTDRLLRCGADLKYYPLIMSDRGLTHVDPVPQ
jgi:putative component of membrane protein insertase Oxa1/YidC/SpoIIIJ protein YidD